MRLIDRYIFRQVAIACIAAVAFFTFVMMTANALKDLLGVFLAGQLSLGNAVELMLLLATVGVMYALPMGVLCGVLLVLGRLSSDSEVTALRAAGQSIVRIGMPIYVFAVLGVVSAIAVNIHFMPRARVSYQKRFSAILSADPLKVLTPKTFVRWRGASRLVVYVGGREGNELRDVWVWFLDREQRVERLGRAQSGRIHLDEKSNELVVVPESATLEIRREKAPEDFSEDVTIVNWETTGLRVPLEDIFGQTATRQKLEWMTLEELRSESVRLQGPVPAEAKAQREREKTRMRMVIPEKLAMALAVLSFAIVAVPLGIKVSRRETSANLGLAVALALTYYFLTVMVKWLDQKPQLHPELLIWLPNLLFIGVGIWLTIRAERT